MFRAKVSECRLCATSFVQRSPNNLYCSDCARRRQRDRNRNWMKRKRNIECTVPDEAVAVLAIEDPQQRHEAIMELVK